MNTRIIVLLWVLLGLPGQARAQSQARSESARASALGALQPGERIRVRAADALRVEGAFLAVEGDRLLVDQDGRVRRLSIDRIEELSVRKRATGRGALIGGITGLVVGVAMGLVIGEVLCDDEDCRADTLGAVGLIGGLGAGVGAAGGALIGSMVLRWQVAFPYRRR